MSSESPAFRIVNKFGIFSVEALDSNAVWIKPEGGVDNSFSSEQEARDYIEEWGSNPAEAELVTAF